MSPPESSEASSQERSPPLGRELPPDLKARISQAVAQQPSPVRRVVRSRARALLASALVVPLVAFWAVGAANIGSRPLALVLATTGGSAVIALLSLWVALGRGGQMLGRARLWLVSIACAAPLFFFAWKVFVSQRYELMSQAWPGRPGFRCLALTALIAAWPLCALALIRRGSDPTHPRSLGAALGVAAGTSAAVLVDLWCPIGDVSHVLLGHLVPIALSGLAGAWIGDRVLALRGRR